MSYLSKASWVHHESTGFRPTVERVSRSCLVLENWQTSSKEFGLVGSSIAMNCMAAKIRGVFSITDFVSFT